MLAAASVSAAPYAAIVINAETGEVLHEENANTRLHPAGLTKLMTLYVLFDALETGLIGLDDEVIISNKAASESPVKLGLEARSKIKIRYLLRATAVNGANDASTALGEGLDGSESAFARRMNGYSKELGLSRSTWKNAHGLAECLEALKAFKGPSTDIQEQLASTELHTSHGATSKWLQLYLVDDQRLQ